MSFQCTYCHIGYEETSICHRVKPLFVEDTVLVSLCDHCHGNYMKMKQKQEEDSRIENEICQNEKCENKREEKYKYCKACLVGIREVIHQIKQTEVSNRNALHQCNQKYGTDYWIMYPSWNLRFW